MAKEEDILQRDVAEFQRELETYPEMKISQAMQAGLSQGKKRVSRARYSLGIAAAAAALLLGVPAFLDIGAREIPASAAVYTDTGRAWKESAIYSSAPIRDESLVSALERNLIQPIYTSVEQSGFRVEIMGGVTDGRKVMILYSVRNETEQTVIHAGFELHYGSRQISNKGASLDMAGGSSQIQPGETVYFAYTANLAPSDDQSANATYELVLTEISTKALVSSSNKYRTRLSVPFQLDPNLLETEKLEWPVPRTLTVAGQRVLISQVLYTPLNTYVDMEYAADNEQKIYGLLQPALHGTNGADPVTMNFREVLSAENSDFYQGENQATLVFAESGGEVPDSAMLQADGISALPKNRQQIVVDINRMEVVEAPDEGVSIITPPGEAAEGQLFIKRQVTQTQTMTYDGYSMRLKAGFTDADGRVHEQGGDAGVSSSSVSDDEVTEGYGYNFGPDAGSYPQPLIIEIERYWNPVLDPASVELSDQE